MNQKLKQSGLRTKAQSGFTLLEVLVALLVLAIGLVGIASLQIAGLRNAHSSYYTSIASSVALDFEERLWLGMTDIDDGCIDLVAVNNIIGQLQTDWGTGAGGFITIPNLQVNLVNFDTVRLDPLSLFDYWAEVRINVSWTDNRFRRDLENPERFPYTARVVCAPEVPDEQV